MNDYDADLIREDFIDSGLFGKDYAHIPRRARNSILTEFKKTAYCKGFYEAIRLYLKVSGEKEKEFMRSLLRFYEKEQFLTYKQMESSAKWMYNKKIPGFEKVEQEFHDMNTKKFLKHKGWDGKAYVITPERKVKMSVKGSLMCKCGGVVISYTGSVKAVLVSPAPIALCDRCLANYDLNECYDERVENRATTFRGKALEKRYLNEVY